MNTRIAALLVAAGIAGVAVGGGVTTAEAADTGIAGRSSGVAAAMPHGGDMPEHMNGIAAADMAAMHAAMRDEMPAELRAACDALHSGVQGMDGQRAAMHESHHAAASADGPEGRTRGRS